MRRGAPSSLPAPSRGRTRDSALWLGAQLCQALQGEQDTMVEALLRQGADPNLVLPEGIAAVHLAAGMEPASGVPCLARILQYGGDPNLRSVDGLTPLHVAASWGHDTRVRLLLMEGGNPWLEDQEGNTALDLARKHGNEGCTLLLRGCLADTEEEEQSSWMSQRRAESFLSTVTADPWEAEGSLGFCPPAPALPGRTPESGADPPGGPRSCCFPSVVAAAAARGGAPENGLEEEEEEDWQPPSFLTECSWQDATGPNRGGLPPRRVSSRDPPGPFAKEEEEEEEAANDRMAEGAWDPQPPRDWPWASVKASGSRSLESRSSREGDLSPGPERHPRGATLSSPEASPPGVRPGALSTAGSLETPKPPPPRPEGPGHKDDLERQDTGATLDLTQDSRFLDPELVVRIGRHQGLDVTSPDHAYLFSRADPATLSDLERTVAVGGEPGGCWETGKPFCRDSGGSGGGGSSSLYASCHSECYGGTTDTSGCQAAQQSSSDHSPGCSGTGSGCHPRQVPLGRGLCCKEGPAAGSPNRSAGAGPLQGGCCLGGALPRMDSEKQPGDAQVLEGLREASPSCLPHVPLTASPWQKEGSGKPPARPPLREPQSLSPRQAEKEVLPESHPFPKGTDVAALEPRREGGRRRMPDGRGDLEEEEEEGETAPAGVSESTQVVLGTGESPWDQDTLLVQRPPEDVVPFGSCGGPLSAGESEGAGFTLPVPDGPARGAGDEPDRLEVQLRSMMLATKFRHVTHRAATPDGGGSSSSSSSSLFEETLEMPRRPRRVRSPEAKPPPSRKEPHGTLCPETSIPPRMEADGPDRGPFIAGSPSSSQPGGSGPSDLPPPAPAMPMDRYFHKPGGSAGRGPSGDPEAKSPGQEREPSPPLPRSHRGDATSLETAPAERPGVRGGEAKGAPRPARVSFSRRPARGLPCPPAMSTRPPGRLSPGSQAIPLSPGGRPIHVSATEPVEFLYVDEDQGHTLVERHVPCTDDSLANTTAEDTVLYDWRAYAHPAARQEASPPPPASGAGPLSDEALASRLRDLGVHPGPVTGLTRKLYLQLLEKLSGDPKTKARKGPSGYSPELSLALETYQIPDAKGDEMALAGQFDQPDKKKNWREGLLKSSFNYLLLDPRVTQNLPFRSQFVSQAECFRTFVSAVFYVGKGKRSRPYSHLYEALNHHHHHHQGKGREKELPPKVRHILEVWAAGQGVVSMHCFQNVIPVEAYTREACMVDAIGLKMLTNQKRGNYYGVVASWPMKRRRRLGVHLLHRAMQILLAEGERQLRPADIQAGP